MTPDQPWAPARVTIASTPVDYKALSPAELIGLCVRGDEAAWNEFIRSYNSIIVVTASRVARHWGDYSPQVIPDLAQMTYQKLCAHGARVLREFRFDHPDAFPGFLRVVTANIANDYFKREYAEKRGRLLMVPLDESVEQGAGRANPTVLTPLDGIVLFKQVESYLRSALPPETRERDLTIFRLYFRRCLTAKQIAALPLGLTVKGVESLLHRLVRILRKFLE